MNHMPASEFTSHGLYCENVLKMTGERGLSVKHSISLSMFTYNPCEVGFSLRVAYQLNYVFSNTS